MGPKETFMRNVVLLTVGFS